MPSKKKAGRDQKKLKLSKQTVRRLSPVGPDSLREVQGGALFTRYCTTVQQR